MEICCFICHRSVLSVSVCLWVCRRSDTTRSPNAGLISVDAQPTLAQYWFNVSCSPTFKRHWRGGGVCYVHSIPPAWSTQVLTRTEWILASHAACKWDGVYSDWACWGFSQKFHVIIENNYYFLRFGIWDSVQSPVTKCPHLYLNCSRACGQHRRRWPNI